MQATPQPDEPLTITRAKVYDLVAALGIATEPRNIRSISFVPQRIEVVRYRLSERGSHVIAGDEAATETIVIGIVP